MYVYEFDIFLNVNDIVHTVNNTKYNKNQLNHSTPDLPFLGCADAAKRERM